MIGLDSEQSREAPESQLPDMEALLVENNEALMHDPSVKTISIRRHGAYNRGAAEGKEHLKGQLTKQDRSFEGVNEVAEEWVDSLPDEVDVEIIASPTFMPAERPVPNEAQKRHPDAVAKITPRRASVTSSLYAAKLRERFGDEFGGYLATEDLSERGQEVREALGLEEPENARQLDQRLGDIFEYTTAEESAHIGKFFKTLGATYEGGMGNKNFWPDFIRGNLPKELNDAYLAAGGDTAVEKAGLALEVIEDYLDKDKSEDDKKQVALLVSHEEVIGSLAYQIQEYVKDKGLADDEVVAALDANKFGYNQGFDMHVNSEGQATFEIAGQELKDIDLNDLKQYVAEKISAQEHLQNKE